MHPTASCIEGFAILRDKFLHFSFLIHFCTIFATFSLKLCLDTDAASKLQTDSSEVVEAKEIENHVSLIIHCWRLMGRPNNNDKLNLSSNLLLHAF